MNWENITIKIDEDLIDVMEERGIKEEDVKKVIFNCEKNNEKLYNASKDRFLAKKRLGEFTVYVEYSVFDEGYILKSTYGHRVQIISDIEG